MGILVRSAEEKDLAFVSQDGYVSADVVQRKIEDGEVLVAEVDGELAGYLRIEFWWNVRPYIALIRVLDPYQRKGVGRTLLLHLEEMLRSAGHSLLFSSSRSTAREARRIGAPGTLHGIVAGELFT